MWLSMPCIINLASPPYRRNNQEQSAQLGTNFSYQRACHSFILVFLSSHYVPMPSLCSLTGRNMMHVGPALKNGTNSPKVNVLLEASSVSAIQPSLLALPLALLNLFLSHFKGWIWSIVEIYIRKTTSLQFFEIIDPSFLTFLFKKE